MNDVVLSPIKEMVDRLMKERLSDLALCLLFGMLAFLMLLMVVTVFVAHAEPDTFEQECQTFYGNPDGSWCTWTRANGQKWLVGSNDYYQQGHPLWGSEHW